jgi:serine/threonine-protein kinase RsbW
LSGGRQISWLFYQGASEAPKSGDWTRKWTIPLRVLSLFCQVSGCRVDPIKACELNHGVASSTVTNRTGQMRQSFSYEIRNQPKALQGLKQELELTLFAAHKDSTLRATILLVIDELVSNLLKYGFGAAPHQRLYLNVAFDDDSLEIELKDNGHPFNPLLQPQPNLLDQELLDRQVGGLGIYLVRKMMDEAHYEWIPPWNCLRLRKRREEGRE